MYNIYLLYWKDENREKEAGNVPFLKHYKGWKIVFQLEKLKRILTNWNMLKLTFLRSENSKFLIPQGHLEGWVVFTLDYNEHRYAAPWAVRLILGDDHSFLAPGRFFDGHIFDGHIIDGHIIDGTYFRRDIFSASNKVDTFSTNK